MDESLRKAVLSKVAWRLLPFLFLLYAVNILDRVNVGFARLQMLEDLGLGEKVGERVYALGFGLFYIGYLMFEVPSNLILARTGARIWISRIMISWGLVTCAMMLIQGPWGFYLLRVLLGFAEAGFFPGIILYLTYWFPARERARVVALFMAASPLTGVLGNPLSGAIMQGMNGVGDLRGWQWLFLLEGIPAVILGVVVLYYLTDRPAQARWLREEEWRWLAAHLEQEETHRQKRHGLSLLQALADGRVWLLVLLYFTVAAGSNAFGSYLAKFIQDRFPNSKEFQIGLLAAIPNLFGMVCMILNGIHSDRTGERRWHVAVPAFVAGLGWVMTAWADSPVLSLVALSLVQIGIMSMLPTFWTIPPSFLGGIAAAGGIALINSVGNLGGFVGPNIIALFETVPGFALAGGIAHINSADSKIVGPLAPVASDFRIGLLILAVIMCIGGLLALCVRHDRAAESQVPSPPDAVA